MSRLGFNLSPGCSGTKFRSGIFSIWVTPCAKIVRKKLMSGAKYLACTDKYIWYEDEKLIFKLNICQSCFLASLPDTFWSVCFISAGGGRGELRWNMKPCNESRCNMLLLFVTKCLLNKCFFFIQGKNNNNESCSYEMKTHVIIFFPLQTVMFIITNLIE